MYVHVYIYIYTYTAEPASPSTKIYQGPAGMRRGRLARLFCIVSAGSRFNMIRSVVSIWVLVLVLLWLLVVVVVVVVVVLTVVSACQHTLSRLRRSPAGMRRGRLASRRAPLVVLKSYERQESLQRSGGVLFQVCYFSVEISIHNNLQALLSFDVMH